VRDIGMPVFRETRRFAFVTPNARFHENEIPGPSFITPPQVFINLADPCSRLTATSVNKPGEQLSSTHVLAL